MQVASSRKLKTTSTAGAMHSSVRSTSPRIVNISSLWNGSVHIDQDITAAGSRVDDPRNRAKSPNMLSISNGHTRAQTSGGPISPTSSAPQPNRWNSELRMSDRSSRHRVSQSHLTRLESNRESMKALSDFLMTKEPPKDNFMSIPESDAMSLHSIKKSAFKIFGRGKKRKEPKEPGFMQLPDSAVAAKTRCGTRHIAISIPIEHDHLESAKQPHHFVSPVAHSQPERSSKRQEMGAVTVLKSVAEVRESASIYLQDEEEIRKTQPESITPPPVIVLGPKATQALENYYTQLHQQQKRSRAENTAKEESSQSYIAVPPSGIVLQDSVRNDFRHSGGIQYSMATLTSLPGHSRDTSSVSAAPGATMTSSLKLDQPPRKSCMTRVPSFLEAELAKTSKTANERAIREDLPRSPVRLGIKNVTSETNSPISPVVTAETAQSHNAVHVGLQTISRGHTPQPSGTAPNRKLPDLPEDVRPSITRLKTAPLVNQIKLVEDEKAKRSSVRGPTTNEEAILVTGQSRQARVKARKQRDMASLREKNSSRSTGEAEGPLFNKNSANPKSSLKLNNATLTASAKSPKRSLRGTASQGHDPRRAAHAHAQPISVSPIMLVASLEPYMGVVLVSDLPVPRSPKNKTRKSNSSSTVTRPVTRTHTPPRSFASSFGSDSDTIPNPNSNSHIRTKSQRSEDRGLGSRSVSRHRKGSARGNGSASSGVSGLENRRQERRMKRNASAREKELDRRLGKIERDNEVLLRTLGGVAMSFRTLEGLLSRGNGLSSPLGVEVGRGLLKGGVGSLSPQAGEEKDPREDEVRNIEPVMRELQRVGVSPSLSE
jgi:hypothetical protein